MTSANQTPEGYKFAPLVASQQRGANQHEPACFAILCLILPVKLGRTSTRSSPALVFSAAIYFAMKRSAHCSAVRCHFPSSWAAVVGVDAKSSEVAQETPHPLFSRPPPTQTALPPILRASRTSAVSYPPYAPQTPRTKSTSCAKSPRCSS